MSLTRSAPAGLHVRFREGHEMGATNLDEVILAGEPISWVVIVKWKWPLWLLPSLVIVRSVFLFFILASALGHIFTANGIVGSIDLPGHLVIGFFVQPLLIGYHLWFPRKTIEMFDALKSNGVIVDEDIPRYLEFVAQVGKCYSGRKVFWLSFLIALCSSVWITILALHYDGWHYWLHHTAWAFYIFELPVAFLASYAMAYIILRAFVLVWAVSNLYRNFTINVQPLHQDGAGGMAAIGDLVVSYGYWVFAAAAFIASAGITTYYLQGYWPSFIIVELIALPIITVAAFFLPIMSTHRAMFQSSLSALSRYNTDFNDLIRKRCDDNAAVNKEDLVMINQLLETSAKIRASYPYWPFNVPILRRFLWNTVASTVPLILSIAQQLIAKRVV